MHLPLFVITLIINANLMKSLALYSEALETRDAPDPFRALLNGQAQHIFEFKIDEDN